MMRTVTIEPVSNGFIVKVGCQTLVFNSIEVVADRLIAYQKDPEGEEKKHYENAINKSLLEPTCASEQRAARGINARLHPADYGTISENVPDECAR